MMMPEQFQTTHQAMGTVMAHKAFGKNGEACLAAVCAEIDSLEQLMSRFIPDSEISRLNAFSGLGEWEPLSQPVFDVLMQAVDLSQRCRGLFDVTVGPLVDLWSHCKHTATPPSEDDIEMTLPLINTQDMKLNPYDQTARLNMPGQTIDLGGIGKGYAGDKIASLYREYNITSAYSNIGGNVLTIGAKPDGSPWRIGIQHPRNLQEVVGTVAVMDRSVVTSGDYQRSYIASSNFTYHHILDLRTGHPSKSDLISVTVVAEKGVIADVLSTALFVAGLADAAELLEGFPCVDVILINREFQVFISDGLKTCFYPQTNIKVSIL